jgi:hypothetical protein
MRSLQEILEERILIMDMIKNRPEGFLFIKEEVLRLIEDLQEKSLQIPPWP